MAPKPRKSGRKTILLGIGGGIAAYKAASLVRLAKRDGFEVQVLMTRGAQRFVTPLTFQALSGRPVSLGVFDAHAADAMEHIHYGDEAAMAIVAPATANLLARLAHGMAKDAVSTTLLAFSGPVLLAPAMNDRMYANPAVQENLATLRSRGFQVVGPEAGDLACGHVGQGRMSEPEEIWAAAREVLQKARASGPLYGRKVLVTAGPTQEPLDAVRYLTNPSSGKMGYAIADAAHELGADVTLITGPTSTEPPSGEALTVVSVRTALEMAEAVWSRAPSQDVVVMAAAVSDFRFASVHAEKLSKETLEAGEEGEGLHLLRNPDILAELSARRGGQSLPLLVGFAMETKDLESRMVEKRARKKIDWIVGNNLHEEGAGFAVDTNRVRLLCSGNSIESVETWPLLSKREVAARLATRIAEALTKAAAKVPPPKAAESKAQGKSRRFQVLAGMSE